MEYDDILIILDNGHGSNTPGKCSPDKSLLEYKYCREIVDRIITKLTALNIRTHKLVPEDTDISLSTRCNRANKLYQDNNKKAILISVHNNAAGADGKWHNATGWTCWIYTKASAKSKTLAECLNDEAEKMNLKGNRSRQKYWTANFYILKHTNCPAVLTENLFQDNKEDVEFLLSEEGKDKIANLHVNAILKYLSK